MSEYGDLAYALRAMAQDYREPDSIGPLLAEAADEIDRLQAIVDRTSETPPAVVCDKHRENPARIYGRCIGCELDYLRAQIATLTARAEP